MIGPMPACVDCLYFRMESQGITCDAFPEGIPDAILMGSDHTAPYPGDGGVRFRARPGLPSPEMEARERAAKGKR